MTRIRGIGALAACMAAAAIGAVATRAAGTIPAPADGQAADDIVVALVRHAEKLDGDDPALSPDGRARAEALAHTLSSWDVEAIYVSQFRRTRETAGPLSEAQGVAPETVDARDVSGLAARIREGSARRVVVIGHSNTVPAMVRALGAGEPGDIAEDTYDDLYVVTLPGGEGTPRLVHLKYGAPTPGR